MAKKTFMEEWSAVALRQADRVQDYLIASMVVLLDVVGLESNGEQVIHVNSFQGIW